MCVCVCVWLSSNITLQCLQTCFVRIYLDRNKALEVFCSFNWKPFYGSIQNKRGRVVLSDFVQKLPLLTFLTMFIPPFNFDNNVVTFSMLRCTYNFQQNNCIKFMFILFWF